MGICWTRLPFPTHPLPMFPPFHSFLRSGADVLLVSAIQDLDEQLFPILQLVRRAADAASLDEAPCCHALLIIMPSSLLLLRVPLWCACIQTSAGCNGAVDSPGVLARRNSLCGCTC